ncbi:MAG: transketolase family protein [Nanoarchaeota archaeon]|nr:transketolase family protein [Nanoarchaeota archaeon]
MADKSLKSEISKGFENSKNFQSKATRDGFGEGIAEIGKNNDIVVLDADLAESTRSIKFQEKYPERFFDFGIAEQNMVATAGGLAASGKIPFACSFAVFLTGRAYGQIRLMAGISHLNMKLIGSHAGLLTGEDGASHQSLEDISLMRGIPGMVVIQPADFMEAKKATIEIAKYTGPVYLRLGRGKVHIINKDDYKFKIGKGIELRDGKDITIIATGALVDEALRAHDELKKQGISARIINIHTIKPLDKELIIKAAKETSAIVTAEDHSIYGGLGSAVSEVLAENTLVKLERIGVKDTFGESGAPDELYKKYGLTTDNIVKVTTKIWNEVKK